MMSNFCKFCRKILLDWHLMIYEKEKPIAHYTCYTKSKKEKKK